MQSTRQRKRHKYRETVTMTNDLRKRVGEIETLDFHHHPPLILGYVFCDVCLSAGYNEKTMDFLILLITAFH